MLFSVSVVVFLECFFFFLPFLFSVVVSDLVSVFLLSDEVLERAAGVSIFFVREGRTGKGQTDHNRKHCCENRFHLEFTPSPLRCVLRMTG